MDTHLDISRIRNVLQDAGIKDHAILIAAVSGGADSMAMLHVLSETLKYRVVVGHVNYGKRGLESDKDEILVRRFCQQHDIPVFVKKSDNVTVSHKPGNFQDYARQVRRQFLEDVMNDHNAEAIVLAHHKNDQIETIIQKLLRGSSPSYWSGMPAIQLPWIRPFLDTEKSFLLSYCHENTIPWREDASNQETVYARNMLRNDVFPKFSHLFPGWESNILDLSYFAETYNDLLDRVLQTIYKKELRDSRHGIDRTGWLMLSERIKPAIIKHWVTKTVGFRSWSKGLVQSLHRLSELQTGATMQLSDGLFLHRDRDLFHIQDQRHPSCEIHKLAYDLFLTDSEVVLCQADSMGSGYGIDQSDQPIGSYSFKIAKYDGPAVSSLQLDLSKLSSKMHVRPWKKGDRFRPFGMKGSQRVSDHLAGKKISSILKNKSLVLVSFEDTIHAVIFPHPLVNGQIGTISEDVRCESRDDNVLLIKSNRT